MNNTTNNTNGNNIKNNTNKTKKLSKSNLLLLLNAFLLIIIVIQFIQKQSTLYEETKENLQGKINILEEEKENIEKELLTYKKKDNPNYYDDLIEDMERNPQVKELESGMYEIGIDINPGLYKVKSIDGYGFMDAERDEENNYTHTSLWLTETNGYKTVDLIKGDVVTVESGLVVEISPYSSYIE